jgi:hypothetical protein
MSKSQTMTGIYLLVFFQNKGLTRLYVTHYHPDHLLGASTFEASMFTLPTVAKKIATVATGLRARSTRKRAIPSRRRRDRQTSTSRKAKRSLTVRDWSTATFAARKPRMRLQLPSPIPRRSSPLFLGELNFASWRADVHEHFST